MKPDIWISSYTGSQTKAETHSADLNIQFKTESEKHPKNPLKSKLFDQ